MKNNILLGAMFILVVLALVFLFVIKFPGDSMQDEIKRNSDGTVKITNVETGEEIIKERDFWFAWYAFHPETTLYEMKGGDINES